MTLPAAIEELYAVFAPYRSAARDMDACPCCVSHEDIKALFAHPLRQLPTSSLEKYSWKAMTTWGNETDFRHFLPRMMELAWRDELDTDFVANKVVGFAVSEAETQALRGVFTLILREAVESHNFWRLSEWLPVWATLGPNESQFWADLFANSPTIFRAGLAEILKTDWEMLSEDLVKIASSPIARRWFESEFENAFNSRDIEELTAILEWLDWRDTQELEN